MNDALPIQPPAIARHGWLGAVLAVLLPVLAVCLARLPRWESNDDVGMAMLAHGYGMADAGSPHLVFSNVVWGHIVRSLPSIGGIDGYALAAFGALVLAGTGLLYGLVCLGHGWVLAGCMAALVLVKPVLLPQFTITAGLLTVAGVVCFRVHGANGRTPMLWAGTAMWFLGCLVRSHEFLLVVFMALPLLPWGAWRTRWHAPAQACGLLAAALLASAFLDWQAYTGPEWRDFNDLNLVRAAFTDFGAGNHLKTLPDLLARHGYSPNDIDLLARWFFADPHVANPEALRSMLSESGMAPLRDGGWASGWAGLRALWHPDLLPALATALLLGFLRPQRSVASSWLLCMTAVFLLGLLGRPGVLRVYVPLLALLAIAPLLAGPPAGHGRRRGTLAIAVLAACVNSWLVATNWQAIARTDDQARQALASLPQGPIVVWGDRFPFEAAYRPLGGSAEHGRYRLYSLGAFTLVPHTVAREEALAGRGLIRQLQQPEGVIIIADESHLKLLDRYCRERLHGQPAQLQVWRSEALAASRQRCMPL